MTNFHEDFGDEPSIEEQIPEGVSVIGKLAIYAEAASEVCEFCANSFDELEIIRTGTLEYYTMDIDPESVICIACYGCIRDQHIPSDPLLFDCLTPALYT